MDSDIEATFSVARQDENSSVLQVNDSQSDAARISLDFFGPSTHRGAHSSPSFGSREPAHPNPNPWVKPSAFHSVLLQDATLGRSRVRIAPLLPLPVTHWTLNASLVS